MKMIRLALMIASAGFTASAVAGSVQPSNGMRSRLPVRAVSATLPSLGPAGDGRRKYVELQCYLCHGNNGGGQFGPNIREGEIADLTEAVTSGVPEFGMPAYGKAVTKTDLSNISAYLKSVGTSSEPTWWDWWLPYPTQ